MILKTLPIIFIIFISGCSLKEPANISQYKANNAFRQYQKSFLYDENLLAKSDLKRAIKYAKTDSNLDQLATIYLGECALNISVGLSSGCKEYKNIETLIDNQKLISYYHLINNKIKKDEIQLLPKVYRKFATYLIDNNVNKAFNEILNMEKISSMFISSAIIKDKLSKEDTKKLIKIASFNGYKKSLLFWMKQLKDKTKNYEEKKIIERKILILK